MKFYIHIFLIFLSTENYGQVKDTLYLKAGTGNEVLNFKISEIEKVDTNTLNSINKSAFNIIEKGIIRLERVDNIVDSFVAKYSYVYILLVKDKSKDTFVVFTNDTLLPILKWNRIECNQLPNTNMFFENRGVILTTIETKFVINNDTLKLPINIALVNNNRENTSLKNISVFSQYFTVTNLIINKEPYFVYIINQGLHHYFKNKTAGIKIVKHPNALLNNDSQFYRLGDTININETKILFSEINNTGDTLLYTQIAGAKVKISGFNEGYIGANFKTMDINLNRMISIDSVLTIKDFLLVDFWGTWCAPCISGMPKLRKLQLKYKQVLNIMSIACESDDVVVNKVKDANKKYKMKWYNAIVNRMGELKTNSIIYKYGVRAYPTYFLLNKKREIIIRVSGAEHFDKIDKFLANYLSRAKE